MDSVNIVASGYEWCCPKCSTLNKELEYTTTVECTVCWTEFEANPPEPIF